MLPTANKTKSVKMISLATGMIVTRDQFKIRKTSAVARMNTLAAVDGITSVTTLHHLSTAEPLQAQDVDLLCDETHGPRYEDKGKSKSKSKGKGNIFRA